MIDDLAGWLQSVAPGLGGYELLAIQFLALGATLVLLLLSVFALSRAARLLSDTLAIRLRTDSIETANVRLTNELQGLRERYAVLVGEASARKAPAGASTRMRKATRQQSAYTRRYDDPRSGPAIH